MDPQEADRIMDADTARLNAVRRDRMENLDRGKPFVQFWAEKIYPCIKEDYERMLQMPPTRQSTKAEKKAERKAEKKADKKEKKGSKENTEDDSDKEDAVASAASAESAACLLDKSRCHHASPHGFFHRVADPESSQHKRS